MGTSHTILLVDDNQELLRLLARLVEGEGWRAVSCVRGKSALDAIPIEKPAAAVVDVLLPDMMGYDIGAALKKAGVPFVFMTGIFKGGRAASEARVQHGAAGYFEKPFEAKKLLEVLRGLLPPPTRAAPSPALATERERSSDDFDVEMAVESEEAVDALSLTGKVEVMEDGRISAVIRGESLQAAPLAARPPPLPSTEILDAARLARVEPPDEGELRDNLPELVTAFWLTQQTGELTVQRGKVKKTIYFEKGRPCFAISNLVADRFGPFLVRVGKLTTTQLELCQKTAEKRDRRIGESLVELGILKETEKLYYVAQQMKAIVYSLFGWEEGRYRIHFADRAAQQDTKIDLHPARLISRGVKKLYRPARLARLLPPSDRLIPTQQPVFGLHELELETWEAQLLPHVDGTRTVAQLVALARRPDEQVRASLWALVALEIFEKRA
ncbi:MAG TPA: response regulator [Anaeromyxobacteraceae bacterium]